jgi:hypothetical protein
MTTLRTILSVAAVAGALISSTSAGFAQGTAEQRAACTGDAFRLCSSHIPNVSAVTACMKTNFTKLSPGCKAVFGKA